jgi:hypothetical protein
MFAIAALFAGPRQDSGNLPLWDLPFNHGLLTMRYRGCGQPGRATCIGD